MTIVDKPCANMGGLRDQPVTRIVLHLMDGTLTGTDAWFNDPRAQASTHYGIGKKGEVHRYVPEDRIAWHAGRVNSPSVPLPPGNPNLYSIGIEHEGRAADELPLELYLASARLLREIAQRHQIPLDAQHVLLHREIFSKKVCPGKLDRALLLAMAKHIEPAAMS